MSLCSRERLQFAPQLRLKKQTFTHPSFPHKMRRVLALVALVALVGCAAASSKSFGVVIDAGSTGSRIHVFSWPTREGEVLPKSITVPIEFATQDCDDPITVPEGIAELDGLLAYARTQVRGSGRGGRRSGAVGAAGKGGGVWT
jgi:GDA1/CD39 (nucleoside phosphatase) family